MMKFVLIVIIFISLQYESSQYGMLSHIVQPYYNTDRYSQNMYGYPQIPTFYSAYRNFIPENRSYFIPKETRNVEQMPSQMDDIQSRLHFLLTHLKKIQDPSVTNNSSKTANNPNAATYKGKPTRKTSASFRSASV